MSYPVWTKRNSGASRAELLEPRSSIKRSRGLKGRIRRFASTQKLQDFERFHLTGNLLMRSLLVGRFLCEENTAASQQSETWVTVSSSFIQSLTRILFKDIRYGNHYKELRRRRLLGGKAF